MTDVDEVTDTRDTPLSPDELAELAAEVLALAAAGDVDAACELARTADGEGEDPAGKA